MNDPQPFLGPAEHHRRVAGAFTDRVRGTRDWSAPAPVAGWTARDVVGHLVGWLPGFLAGGGVTLPTGQSAEESMSPVHAALADPAGAWQLHSDAVQTLLDDSVRAAGEFSHPMVGMWRLADAIDRFYTADVFMHTWDLARATGQDETLDPAFCTALLGGMTDIEDVLRGSGQYGPAVPVAADAGPQDRLLGFIGRDPAWRPPG